MVAGAKMKGPERIIALDLSDDRLVVAKRCGADSARSRRFPGPMPYTPFWKSLLVDRAPRTTTADAQTV
jgi:hypothetical protein